MLDLSKTRSKPCSPNRFVERGNAGITELKQTCYEMGWREGQKALRDAIRVRQRRAGLLSSSSIQEITNNEIAKQVTKHTYGTDKIP